MSVTACEFGSETAGTPRVSRLLDVAEQPDAAAATLRAQQILGRLVPAEEVAVTIASLAYPRSVSINGTGLAFDGGMASLRV